ncbi:uncharacterized protein LOC117066405 isoform X1 [Trachypithecus francoisi]|uniref:uncharacterized protein LOC117066405 isoform X1 n=1 Tax=Trachypithecus francoisi TaxID=54180 RepID=UPI00141B033C|nr:uncharacterized protein LOC117066405 isoform X1 [Trachypithecus francoisi]
MTVHEISSPGADVEFTSAGSGLQHAGALPVHCPLPLPGDSGLLPQEEGGSLLLPVPLKALSKSGQVSPWARPGPHPPLSSLQITRWKPAALWAHHLSQWRSAASATLSTGRPPRRARSYLGPSTPWVMEGGGVL